ncbi:MAG: regulatory protein RecX [Bacteroidales bacterium]|nr:regulatory protein RecX [Bacteroidales bacterium]HOK99446.1 regulatory protein RecX [Bacteroidales bacterium]HPO66310.1 regulatory protein RecX [Bacteroidales bacterium]
MAKPKNHTALTYDTVRQQMANYCSKAERCRNDVLKKLRTLPLQSDEKASIIEYLEKEGYINDLRYAKAFVHDKLHFDGWGKLKIKIALQQKNIDESIIESALNDIDDATYIRVLTDILTKKLKTLPQTLDSFERKHKLFQFGYQRGFGGQPLEEVIEKLL